jgi:tellurite resistance protein
MHEPLDLSKVSENERLAFYGALLAVATADGQIDKDEMELVFGLMDLENMSEQAKREVQSYIITPPTLWDCLRKLSQANEILRFGLMVNIVDISWANDELDSNEEKAILLAKSELNVTDQQLEAIKTFIQKMREIRTRGLDGDQAADALKLAASGLSAVGVPIAALYFSGSVVGFSAAGITSGLAALGLGFGMVPGIGLAVLVGAGIFWGVSQMLDVGGHQAKEEAVKKEKRKAQLVIENMQGAINQLITRITNLQEKVAGLTVSAADVEANRESIRILTDRLKFMQQSVTKRQQIVGVI